MSDTVRGRLLNAPNWNSLWSALVVEELLRCGVDAFCISPGSRSTPLTWAVAEHPRAKSIVHFDERGAAFHALGITRASGKPVAFICTSGTAVANALPAVIEASMAHVPLILLTADRPPELHDIGANQTIDQENIYGRHVRWEQSQFGPATSSNLQAPLTMIDQAVGRATETPAGPVHLNCMFREPLEPNKDDAFTVDLDPIQGWPETDAPYTQSDPSECAPDDSMAAEVESIVNSSRRGLLLIGQLTSQEDRSAAGVLAKALGWPILPDVSSGLRLNGGDASLIHYYDRLLAVETTNSLLATADTIMHVGGALTSKPLLQMLEGGISDGAQRAYIRVAPHTLRLDPAKAVTHRIVASISTFAKQLEEDTETPIDNEWRDALTAASVAAGQTISQHVERDDSLSEISVAHLVTREAPAASTLFLGNSMPIRDADMFGAADGNGPAVAANRGASGIDGNIATAAGHARGTGKPVTAVIGDLAALHDLNSLILLRDLPAPVVLVVINNDGGGIFHFLPIAEHQAHFEPYFGTPHGVTLEGVARSFGIDHHAPATCEAFLQMYRPAIAGDVSCIIEVRSDRELNKRQHADINAAITAALK